MITSAVTKVPAGASKARRTPPDSDTPKTRGHEDSSGVFVFSRSITGALVSLLIFMLICLAYGGSAFFTREQQFDHGRELQKQMRLEIQELRVKNLKLERRMVEIATTVENMEDQ